VTVVTNEWWINCKVDGTGALLYSLESPEPFVNNVAEAHPEIVDQLFEVALLDAGGAFPDYLLLMAAQEQDAPGCSPLAARRRESSGT
jgi:hypothetical protein